MCSSAIDIHLYNRVLVLKLLKLQIKPKHVLNTRTLISTGLVSIRTISFHLKHLANSFPSSEQGLPHSACLIVPLTNFSIDLARFR